MRSIMRPALGLARNPSTTTTSFLDVVVIRRTTSSELLTDETRGKRSGVRHSPAG
jgi:hypothetical protein